MLLRSLQLRKKRIAPAALAAAFSLLSDQLETGVPLLRALHVLSEQSADVLLRSTLMAVAAEIADGSSLAAALAARPELFSPLDVSMIQAGEEGGFLEESLRRLAAVRERQEEIRSRIVSASAYPLLLATVATLVVALLCCGPVLRAGDHPILTPAPYQWLLSLPGFNELRVPTRFWMLGVLCLSTAAGLAFARLPLRRPSTRLVFTLMAATGLLVDGWMGAMPMAAAPQAWAVTLPPAHGREDAGAPVLELPLGPDFDSAATYRTVFHRRRVVNGVSGYDPPHYAPLQAGLNDRDPAMLAALASLSAYDIAIESVNDPDGAWAQYAANAPGAQVTVRTDQVMVVHVPLAGPASGVNAGGEPVLGPAYPIRSGRIGRASCRERV